MQIDNVGDVRLLLDKLLMNMTEAKLEMNYALDMSSYKALKNRNKIESYRSWYSVSENCFYGVPISTKDELIVAIAYAYSWMPRIPEIDLSASKMRRYTSALKALSADDRSTKRNVVEALHSMLNSSVIGSSKVLYFAYPTIFPIIDANVALAWRNHFNFKRSKKEIVPGVHYLPSSLIPNRKCTSSIKRVSDHYLNYVDCMQRWSATTGKPMRDIEKTLFQRGRYLQEKSIVSNESKILTG